MYVDSSSVRGPKGKTYKRHLLRSSHREGGKVKKRTIANLSHCSDQEIDAIRFALQNRHQLDKIQQLLQQDDPAADARTPEMERFAQGFSVGAVLVLSEIAGELGVTKALGDDKQGRLALWQVIARALDQGSRLSAVRLARSGGRRAAGTAGVQRGASLCQSCLAGGKAAAGGGLAL